MAHEDVLVDRNDRVAWVTLNRPDRLNAMNTSLLHRLGEVIDEVAEDPGVSVMVIRGAGRACQCPARHRVCRRRHSPNCQFRQCHLGISFQWRFADRS